MASANTLCKKLLGVKSAVVTGHDFYQDSDGLNHLRIHARPSKRHENDCPFCHRHCRFYDIQTHSPRIWRSLDWGGTLVEVQYRTTALSVRSTEPLLQMFHGLILGVASPKTLI